MSDNQQGRVPSRGEVAMYGDLAAVVRQVSTAFVALTEGRDVIVERLQEWYREMHLPAGVDHSFGTAAEGTVRRGWEDCFRLVAAAELELQKALFGVTDRALSMQQASNEDADSSSAFKVFGRGESTMTVTYDVCGVKIDGPMTASSSTTVS